MNIHTTACAELDAGQRSAYRAKPTNDFYQAFLDAYQNIDREGISDSQAQVEALGATHNEMSLLRGVDAKTQSQYAAILDRAYSTGAMADPQAFLQNLGADELEVIRKNHCLANAIQPATLSQEGAANLLLPEGYGIDLNSDGLFEDGPARTISFPPQDAPQEFCDAWFELTKGMSAVDAIAMAAPFSFNFIPQLGMPTQQLDSSSLDSYRAIIQKELSFLQCYRYDLPAGQYDREYPFFSKLWQALSEA